MQSKDELLKLLYFYPNNYIKSQDLARRLGLPKTEIYKIIKELRMEGFDIYGCTNRGYALKPIDDIVSPENLSKYSNITPEMFRVFSSLPSTNSTAKEMAVCGAPDGTVCIAESQTKGRGRFDRQFFSPKQTGIYMSVILRPTFSTAEIIQLTPLAAVAVAEAAEKITNEPTQIKWVNDVYFKDKKICGILTEAAINPDTKKFDYVILGIGVNLYTPQDNFPDNIQNIAGSLLSKPLPDARCKMIGEILKHFYHYYYNFEKKAFLEAYRSRSILDGKNVEVFRGDASYRASVLGINDDFSLKIRLSDGSTENLSSGEVSLKI